MLSDFLKKHIESQAAFIKANGYGYGQVEPNHLSAQRTGQVYAQLPAAADIDILENGQYVKYNYAEEVVDFAGPGEWLLVFNEIKLPRDEQETCEFAMIKDNYQARVYSPFGGGVDKSGDIQADDMWDRQSRYYNGVDDQGNDSITVGDKTYKYDDVTKGPDYYEPHYNEDPFHILGPYKEKMMPEGTKMVPRCLKTNVGDIYTTNMINEESLEKGDILSPAAADGILSKSGDGSIQWQVVKVYTMPDHQPGVKIMRIA